MKTLGVVGAGKVGSGLAQTHAYKYDQMGRVRKIRNSIAGTFMAE